MMGPDVERMVAGIEAVKDAASAGIVSLSSATAYQLISRETHAGIGSGPCRPEEIEVPDGDPMSAVSSAMGAMSGDCGKMDSLSGSLYTGTSSFNNGLGSPWTELTKLQQAVSDAEAYSGAHSPFNYVGEKAGMLALLNMVMTAAVDAKWAMIIYHDYIQRGFDDSFNGKKPSVTFKFGLDKESNGNLAQKYNENVNIPTKPLEPF